MAKDIAGVFKGEVEVDETYLGGQKKNKKIKKANEDLGQLNNQYLVF
ncbi:MAG: hypothetical protein ACK4FL_04190 [Microgenomates group bacterium]